MDYEALLSFTKEAIYMIIIASTPAIAASLIIGVAIAIFSATTQIQEQTLSFAPKMIAVYLALVMFGAPLGSMLLTFTKSCFRYMLKI